MATTKQFIFGIDAEADVPVVCIVDCRYYQDQTEDFRLWTTWLPLQRVENGPLYLPMQSYLASYPAAIFTTQQATKLVAKLTSMTLSDYPSISWQYVGDFSFLVQV